MGKLLLAMAHDTEKEAKAQAQAKTPDTPPSAADVGNARAGAEPQSIWSLLSSHPDTIQRATELEQGNAPHCARP